MPQVKPEERPHPAVMLVYSALLLAVLVLGSPYWLVRMLTSGRYRAGLAQRLGRLPAGLRDAARGRQVIWLHAVSVGEVLAATRLVHELQQQIPGILITVSTTTETGQRLAQKRFPDSPVFYLPLDFAFLVRRTLRALQPRVVVLMESELWPNMIHECHRSGIPIAVVNARISDRSFPRYIRLRRLWRPFLQEISLFLAQSAETAERLVRIGAPGERVHTSGNLKYDVRAGASTALTERLGSLLPHGAAVLVAGSTLEGEESLVLDAWRAQAGPATILVIAPRHPDRFSSVANLLQSSELPFVRASTLSGPLEPGSVVLLDTIGDLATVYGLATLAFVGGSLVPAGGHNPLEPAQFGVPVVMGPSYQNFREIVEGMRAEDALRIVTTNELAAAFAMLLQQPEQAQELGRRGREFFLSQSGATERTLSRLKELLV